jgi:hypothetical protein
MRLRRIEDLRPAAASSGARYLERTIELADSWNWANCVPWAGAVADAHRLLPDMEGVSQVCWLKRGLGVVNLLLVGGIVRPKGACALWAILSGCGGEARHFLPGVESVPYILTVHKGGQEMLSRAEMLSDRSIRGETPLGRSSRFAAPSLLSWSVMITRGM